MAYFDSFLMDVLVVWHWQSGSLLLTPEANAIGDEMKTCNDKRGISQSSTNFFFKHLLHRIRLHCERLESFRWIFIKDALELMTFFIHLIQPRYSRTLIDVKSTNFMAKFIKSPSNPHWHHSLRRNTLQRKRSFLGSPSGSLQARSIKPTNSRNASSSPIGMI